MEKQLREKGGLERERECVKAGWGGGGGRDSRDSTAIITDLLEEISTTQTGCLHHIELIDSRGEGEWGVCVKGVRTEMGCVGVSRRRVGGGARQLAPHLAAHPCRTHKLTYLFHITLWARLARCWHGVW